MRHTLKSVFDELDKARQAPDELPRGGGPGTDTMLASIGAQAYSSRQRSASYFRQELALYHTHAPEMS